MSDNTNTAKEEMAKKRLLKANNVQRRAYIKRAVELGKRAKRSFLADKKDAQARVETKLVEREMGIDLENLMLIREQIQECKLQEQRLVKQAEEIRDELREQKGLTITENSWNDDVGFGYYTKPPAMDKPENPDVCKKDLGNEDVQFTVRRCQQNPLFEELQKDLTSLTDKHMELENEIDRLPTLIWGVVTTEEIVKLLEDFRDKWCHDVLIEDD